MNKQFTQHQKILGYMIKQRESQQWFYPYDFMPPRMTLDYIYCVGYEASARMTELATKYPEMIESAPAGKYKKRRIRWDEIDKWLPLLPKDLRYMFHRGGTTKGIAMLSTPPGPTPAYLINENVTCTDDTVSSTLIYRAIYKGTKYAKLEVGNTYTLAISKLRVGKPIYVNVKEVLLADFLAYPNMKALNKDWKII